jgi:hypothetical protein
MGDGGILHEPGLIAIFKAKNEITYGKGVCRICALTCGY